MFYWKKIKTCLWEQYKCSLMWTTCCVFDNCQIAFNPLPSFISVHRKNYEHSGQEVSDGSADRLTDRWYFLGEEFIGANQSPLSLSAHIHTSTFVRVEAYKQFLYNTHTYDRFKGRTWRRGWLRHMSISEMEVVQRSTVKTLELADCRHKSLTLLQPLSLSEVVLTKCETHNWQMTHNWQITLFIAGMGLTFSEGFGEVFKDKFCNFFKAGTAVRVWPADHMYSHHPSPLLLKFSFLKE